MKPYKYLFLMVALFSLALFLISCDKKTNDTKGTNTQATTESKTSEGDSLVSIERATKNYIKGTELDKNNGRIKIVSGGNTKYVQFSQDSVTIEGYDKEKVGEQTLTVKCVNGSESYTLSYTVTVYDIEAAKIIQKPNRVSYRSHETELDLNGGIVEVSAKNGEVKTQMNLNEFDCIGFDSTKATEANKRVPLKQMISVNYNGNKLCEFEVQITYSEVTFVRNAINNVSGFDMDASNFGLSDLERSEIIKAAETYFTFTTQDIKSMTEEELNKLFICASVCGLDEWKGYADQLGDTFAIVDGNLGFRLLSYQTTKNAVGVILGEDSNLLRLSNLLCDIRGEASDTYINKDVTIGAYLNNVVSSDEFVLNANFLEFAVEIYEAIEPVGEWDLTTIKNYSEEVMNAFEIIANSSYSENANLRPAFGIISNWRENNDLFEIIYAYFYELGNDPDTNAYAKACVNVLKRIYLPGPLEGLYSAMLRSGLDLHDLNNFLVIDTTYFVDYYNTVVELAEKVFDEENPLYDMYETFYFYITFDNIVMQNGEYIEAGFSSIVNYLRKSGLFAIYANCLSSERLSQFWDMYIEVYDNVQDGTYEEYDDYATDLMELFDYFQMMSPSEIFDIDYSLCYVYGQNQFFGYYVWDIQSFIDFGSFDITYVGLVSNHLNKVFKENEVSEAAFYDLMLAVESYSRLNLDENAVKLFLEHMDSFEENYGELTASGKALYDELLGKFISDYRKIASVYDKTTYEIVNEITVSELGEYASVFDELKTSYDYLNKLSNKQEYVLEISEILHALSLIDRIVTSNDEKVMAYYSTAIYTYGNNEYTYDMMAANIRYQYKALLTETRGNMGTASYLLYDLIDDAEVKYYISSIYTIVRTYMDNLSGLTVPYDLDLIVQALNKYIALDSEDRFATYSLTYGTMKMPFIFYAISEYLKANYSNEVYECALALADAEMDLMLYENDSEGVSEDGISNEDVAIASYTNFINLYNALTDDEKSELKSVYDSLLTDLEENHIRK